MLLCQYAGRVIGAQLFLHCLLVAAVDNYNFNHTLSCILAVGDLVVVSEQEY